jgi:hypothetical protein
MEDVLKRCQDRSKLGNFFPELREEHEQKQCSSCRDEEKWVSRKDVIN